MERECASDLLQLFKSSLGFETQVRSEKLCPGALVAVIVVSIVAVIDVGSCM